MKSDILIGGHVVHYKCTRGFFMIYRKTTVNERSPSFFFFFCLGRSINFQSLSSLRPPLFCTGNSCNIECNVALASESTIWIPISCHFLISAWKAHTMHGKFPTELTAKWRPEISHYRLEIITFVCRLFYKPRVFFRF